MRIESIKPIRAGLATLLTVLALALATSGVQGGEPRVAAREPWVTSIRAMDDALARGDLRAALKAREDARLAALADQGWEGLVMVGDATLRLGQGSGLNLAMEPAARRAYVFALYRARRQESFEGLMRVSEALAALGDRDTALKAYGIAGTLAASTDEPSGRARLRALENRLKELGSGPPVVSSAQAAGRSFTVNDDARGFDAE